MQMDILKETSIEYCENIYALSINYLKNHNNNELRGLLEELTTIEDNIRICNDIDILNKFVTALKLISNRIEGIIHE